jgi:hypothetical protein
MDKYIVYKTGSGLGPQSVRKSSIIEVRVIDSIQKHKHHVHIAAHLSKVVFLQTTETALSHSLVVQLSTMMCVFLNRPRPGPGK